MIGIDVFPLASRIWHSGPDVVVVVVVGVDVDIVLVVVLVDVELEVDVELLVESVDVESVVVVSANGLSGPAVPALAK